MEIITNTPLIQAESGYRQFEIELADDGVERLVYVYVGSHELLSYRSVQRAILQATGRIYTYEPAECRGGIAAWQKHVAARMAPEVTVPLRETTIQHGHAYELLIDSLEGWRREHRPAARHSHRTPDERKEMER